MLYVTLHQTPCIFERQRRPRPNALPFEGFADAILDCTARGDLVLDAFLGSGTTVIAAERTGRICYGIEIDPAYVDTMIRRWQAFTGLNAVDESSGRTFNEIEKEVQDGRNQAAGVE